MAQDDVLDRLSYLMGEWPLLAWAAAGLCAAVVVLDDEHPVAVAAMGPTSHPLALLSALLGWLGLAWVAHRYDLALLRLRRLGQGPPYPVAVGRNLCFERKELQEAYERWRVKGPACRAMHATAALLVVVTHLKMFRSDACTATHHALLGVTTSVALVRLLAADRMSSTVYSALSLISFANWKFWLISLLLRGDRCMGELAEKGFTTSTASATFTAFVFGCLTSLMFPVARAHMGTHTAIGLPVWIFSSYLQMLFRPGGVDFSADADGRALLVLASGVTVSFALSFLVNTELTVSSMHHFLIRTRRREQSERRQTPAVPPVN